MKIIGKPAFQGDLGYVEIDAIPATAKAVAPESGVYIVAHSETGHHHVIEARADIEVMQDADDPLTAYLRIAAADVLLNHRRAHDTHASHTIKPGLYMLRRQREYDWAQGWRRAAD